MQQADSESAYVKKQPGAKKLKFLRTTAAVMAGLLIFAIGVGVGSGRLKVSFKHTYPGAANLPANLNYASVEQVYDALRADYDGQLDTSKLLDGLKHGLVTATGDPYTEYFTADEAKQFTSELNNSFSGIGAELSADSDGNIVVISPLKGYPAEKAGLKPHDVIASVNNTSTSGMSIDQAVNKIRGKSGTKVTLKIVRNKTQVLTITITRQDIQLPSVSSKILDGNIGYIQIITFSDDTSSLIKQAAIKLAKDHVKGVILDLRGNPGGLVSAAIDTASQWLPPGTTILQEKGTGGTRTDSATGDDVLHDIPTVVLIDGGTASAAEITSAALHDNSAATLIGEQSYGKGVEQSIINFSDGSELKVTTARWYRPNGQNINKKGITPDKVVKLSDADAKAGNDTQLKAAEQYLAAHHE